MLKQFAASFSLPRSVSFSVLLFCLITSSPARAGIKVGLVLDSGGRDDKSFNSAAFKGATEAEKKLKIELKTVDASDPSLAEPLLRTLAQRGYDLVIGIGFTKADPLKKVAAEFPQKSFLLVDSIVDLPNVRSVTFAEHEGSFLVGALAAMASKTGVIGFVGGMDIPLIRRFALGYEKGAEAINPKVKIVVNYVGTTSDAWKNPTKGKELALSHYQNKADVVSPAAAASSFGVYDAAEEKQKLAIGVDSNQNWIKPGRILTSMVKRVDTAVYDAIEAKSKGIFTGGAVSLGLREGGVAYAIDEFNRKLITPEMEKKANALRDKIIAKELKVADYYEVSKKGPAQK